MRPVKASVTAKQAIKMSALLCRLALLFTAIITNTLSITVKGQARLLKMIVIITVTSLEMSCVFSSKKEFKNLLVIFVEFEPVMLATFRRIK